MQTRDDMALVELEQLVYECEQAAAQHSGDPEIDRLLAGIVRKVKLARMYHLQHMAGLSREQRGQTE